VENKSDERTEREELRGALRVYVSFQSRPLEWMRSAHPRNSLIESAGEPVAGRLPAEFTLCGGRHGIGTSRSNQSALRHTETAPNSGWGSLSSSGSDPTPLHSYDCMVSARLMNSDYSITIVFITLY
jgi:hypothetical protein